MKAFARCKRNMDPSFIERILSLAIQIQQIPSPSFGEKERAGFMRDTFISQGAQEVLIDECDNVLVRMAGSGNQPPLVVSAHLDTVFPPNTDLTCRRTEDKIFGPGIGDNSVGLAALVGLYWYFMEHGSGQNGMPGLDGDIWLVADVGEEGLGDLRGMKSVVNRFDGKPQAYLVLEGMSLGQIYTRGLGVSRYRIKIHTKGGHSWSDYGSPSAIHEIANLVTKFTQLPIPAAPRCSLNVGVIHGGTSVNTIAAEAELELDLRSESPQELSRLIARVEGLINEADERAGEAVQVIAEVIGDRPPGEISPEHVLVKTALECFSRAGREVNLNIGSTDANVPLSRGYPSICMGLTHGGGPHTLGEYIETAPFCQGFNILVDLIQSIFKTNLVTHPQ
jgi:tripeptide aminopeptidase